MRNPRAEAMDALGGDYEARVLEPAPPAVTEPPFTDDPVHPGEVPEGRKLASPVRNRGDITWDELTEADPELVPFAADRWLGAWRRLEPLPASFAETRLALHKLAENVIKEERKPENEIALRFTQGGFGTPYFDQGGTDRQVRVEHGELVRQTGDDEDRTPIEGVDVAAASALGDFYGFSCSVLEELRAEYGDQEPSLVQLWPEHFDIAVDLGLEAKGQKATYGASPGDELHPEPYLYVGPWNKDGVTEGELWNATKARSGFDGAELGYDELLAASDQRQTALEFLRKRLLALTA